MVRFQPFASLVCQDAAFLADRPCDAFRSKKREQIPTQGVKKLHFVCRFIGDFKGVPHPNPILRNGRAREP